MPKLTTEQIKEFLADNTSPETLSALKNHFRTELDRRAKVGQRAIKPRKYEGDAKERQRQAAKQYRERKANEKEI